MLTRVHLVLCRGHLRVVRVHARVDLKSAKDALHMLHDLAGFRRDIARLLGGGRRIHWVHVVHIAPAAPHALQVHLDVLHDGGRLLVTG